TGIASERASVWRAALPSGLAVWEFFRHMATSAGRLVGGLVRSSFFSLTAKHCFAESISPAAPDCQPPP
ncbi:MAG: hypothetical protein WCO99_05055, partial [Planctomycetota bacterium]